MLTFLCDLSKPFIFPRGEKKQEEQYLSLPGLRLRPETFSLDVLQVREPQLGAESLAQPRQDQQAKTSASILSHPGLKTSPSQGCYGGRHSSCTSDEGALRGCKQPDNLTRKVKPFPHGFPSTHSAAFQFSHHLPFKTVHSLLIQ